MPVTHTLPPARIACAAIALVLAAGPSIAQTTPSPSPETEDFAQRLRALERLLGVENAQPADASDLASLDQRLRIIERKLELQAEDAAGIIIKGMEEDKFQVYIGNDARMMNYLYRLSPKRATRFMFNRMKGLLGS